MIPGLIDFSEAVRKSQPLATEKEFRNTITTWLDGAKDRDGGRKHRGLGGNAAAVPAENVVDENMDRNVEGNAVEGNAVEGNDVEGNIGNDNSSQDNVNEG
jgi:hypothetical protein